ncbi:MAG: 16S rRNA (adenine(1518)-N(6)/adenine(1519)-N(6))-dimethyltransferase RsmA [Microscillaceae bacterium]|nr:16S rRNA (adenine(1518)-N(6)/adenine(1519)-N(6))-dimethyltransferase RsmA [Microscillaceae bacterium]
MVKPKKHLGQHFLKDKHIAEKITHLLSLHGDYNRVLEIGPGTGVLTGFLLKNTSFETYAIDVDSESIGFLRKAYPDFGDRLIEGNFLEMDIRPHFGDEPLGIIGNFPYNISSQILFRILDYRHQIKEVVCMLQKEVAERIASPPKNKAYGILSVFLQAYFTIEYRFTVPPDVFDPPPKVQSGVLVLRRNDTLALDCDEKLFRRIVKQGFNNRRKTLRNSLKPFQLSEEIKQNQMLNQRAEELSVADFVYLTHLIAAQASA